MTAEPESDSKQATVFEVRATRSHDDGPEPGPDGEQKISVQRVTERYQVPDAAAALAAFAAARPETVAPETRQDWHLTCVIPARDERPERRRMNWEEDPFREVSDGWLSNLAAQGSNLRDQLTWEPEFCTRAHWIVPCPDCGQPLQERYGKWGGFLACPGCGWKTGLATRKGKAAGAAARITGWCGGLLVVRYSDLGVPYAGCPACDPGYEHPAVNDLRYGKR